MNKNCLILQSGGPTVVINSSLYGIINEAKKHYKNITNIYGSLNGIDGLINDNIIDLSCESDEELIYLLSTPGAILGTARHQLSLDLNDKEYQIILEQCKGYELGYLFLIGGNDSMDTANKLTHFFKKVNYDCKVIGIPKTIDNDLVNIDHTPGYGSAAKFIANTFSELENDICCYQKGKVTIVEVMGRDAGWLTAASKLASINGNGPDLIYLPEVPFDKKDFLNKVSEIYSKKHYALIAVSEGIKDNQGNYIQDAILTNNQNDSFGHAALGGVCNVLSSLVKNELNLPTRGVELSLPQRCASHISSLTDINEAVNCGKYAVIKALNGLSGIMVTMNRSTGINYLVSYNETQLNDVANNVKTFPLNWIINNSDISSEFIEYALPLVQGENILRLNQGLPRYTKLKKIKATKKRME